VARVARVVLHGVEPYTPAQVSFTSSLLITLKPRLSDTNVYEPSIRALLGTASLFCEVVALKRYTLAQVAFIDPADHPLLLLLLALGIGHLTSRNPEH